MMGNKSLLLALPGSIGRSISSEWLSADSLGKLDNAYCSHAERSSFLELLIHTVISNNDISMKKARFTMCRLRWMVDRGVLSCNFTYGWETSVSENDIPVFNSFFHMNATQIKHICIYGDDSLTSLKMDTLVDAAATTCSAVLEELWVHAAADWSLYFTQRAQFPHLRKIHLIWLSDGDLQSICTAAHNLVDIYIEGPTCSDIGFTVIAQHCKGLQKFTIWGTDCMQNIDQAVIALVQGCPLLKHLALGWCYAMTDVALTAVAGHCTNLIELLVSDNGRITDESLIALAHSACASNLQSLTLDGCGNIDGEGILVIAEHCPALHKVHLNGMQHINYHFLCSALPRWKEMRSFNLACCEVNDDVLDLIGDNMALLVELNITPRYEPMYTHAGVLRMVHKCEQLKMLDLDCECRWTEAQIAQLQELRPGLLVDPID